jgi:hypothetical protein
MLKDLQQSGNLMGEDQEKYLECLETFRLQNIKAPKETMDYEMTMDNTSSPICNSPLLLL